jgi:spermidine synthase
MAHLSAGCLDDPRVTVREGDVSDLIREGSGVYDAILLDVDNGPEGLSRKANNRLYDTDGLAAARKALKPGGLLAVWSSAPDAGFTRRLKRAGYAVAEERVRATDRSRGERHVIWMAVSPAR